MKTTTNWATQANPNGFLCQGTVIEISGHENKSENGRFVVESPFPAQRDGGAYLQWRRLGRNGQVLDNYNVRNLRGASSTRIEQMMAAGQFRVVSSAQVAA